MSLLARCLDWLCRLFEPAAQDESIVNHFICGSREPPTDA
ncbi:hypothetical protein L288_03815 [Sphingobium quisquiliarum P25]|uniref:Uncharacterized protein n=1 Tax=Sphingobium quisquiliarum P25 TaxID=1329909 RepID=T0IM36_9SPHN|nr:hypothetical protein L288_03815 [Sphingobium quisquiliarum P25]EZP74016.1 hypothetical protein BV96_00104 [Sphingomonas paucimobilis]